MLIIMLIIIIIIMLIIIQEEEDEEDSRNQDTVIRTWFEYDRVLDWVGGRRALESQSSVP